MTELPDLPDSAEIRIVNRQLDELERILALMPEVLEMEFLYLSVAIILNESVHHLRFRHPDGRHWDRILIPEGKSIDLFRGTLSRYSILLYQGRACRLTLSPTKEAMLSHNHRFDCVCNCLSLEAGNEPVRLLIDYFPVGDEGNDV